MVIILLGVMIALLQFTRKHHQPDLKPGFSAWVSSQGKLRILYYNASDHWVILNTYSPGYSIFDERHHELEDAQVKKPKISDWVRVGPYHTYEFYRATGSFDPNNIYSISIYTPNDSPPKSMFFEDETILRPNGNVTISGK